MNYKHKHLKYKVFERNLSRDSYVWKSDDHCTSVPDKFSSVSIKYLDGDANDKCDSKDGWKIEYQPIVQLQYYYMGAQRRVPRPHVVGNYLLVIACLQIFNVSSCLNICNKFPPSELRLRLVKSFTEVLDYNDRRLSTFCPPLCLCRPASAPLTCLL